ncbi:MAG: HEAT repeat domain-containing protein [Candidatus Wallbacteria bacterium]|nr:HEAT repeat domain-containing protein [Candidatus Wallbacteria bacterium]
MADDLELLICQLRDSRAQTRAEAARVLAQRKSPLAKKDLMRCLSDVSDPVRYWATAALAGLGDKSLQPVLTGQLEDPPPAVRMVAAKAFYDLPYKKAVQPLLKALGDDSENVAEWSSRALSKLGIEVLPQLISALGGRSWRRRQVAAKTIRRIGPGAIDILVKALNRQDKNLQYWVLQLLGELKVRSAAPHVVPFLGCKDTDLLRAAIRAAGELGDRDAVPHLIPSLGHADENVRFEAVRAMSRFGDYSVKQLADLLASDQRVLRLSASMSLAAIGDTTLRAVLEKLSSESQELRYWAVRALEKFDNPAIVPLLVNLLDDEEFDVQVAAATALANFQLPGEVAQDLIARLSVENWRVRKAIAEALQVQTHLPVRMLVDALGSPSEDVRFWVTKILPRFASVDVVRALMARFEDPSWPIRKNAAEGIALMGDIATPLLVEALSRHDLDSNTRYWLTRSLVGNTDMQLLPTLTGLLADADPSLRRNAREAIARFGDRALAQLLEVLKNTESRGVREAVAACVIESHPADFELLTRMYRFREPEVNYWISYIMGHLGEGVLPTLSRMALQGDERERSDALSALEYLPSRETFRICLECLEDEFVSIRRRVVRILGKYRVPEAAPKLIARLKEADDEYLLALLDALGLIGGDAALGAVLPFLSHERWEVRKSAVLAAGETRDRRALGALTSLLRDDARDLLPFVIEALGKLQTDAAADAIAPFVNDADQDVQLRAIAALGQTGSSAHRTRIVPLLGSDRWEVVREALEALGKLGGPVNVDALRPILTGDDLVLRGVAQRTLKHLLGPEKWQELTQVTIRKTLAAPAVEHLEAARGLMAAGKGAEAMGRLKKSLRYAKRWDTYALMGTLHLETRDLSKAQKAFAKALALKPGEPHSLSKLAVCHLLAGEPAKAEPLLEKLLRDPRCPPDVLSFAKRTLGKLAGR